MSHTVTYSDRDVKRALMSLGRSQVMVEMRLRAAGIRGKKEEPSQCPVACYLKRMLKAPWANVDADTCHVGESFFNSGLSRTPVGVAKFIYAFDSGKYPDMVRRGK
jgi:hypothetical protein